MHTIEKVLAYITNRDNLLVFRHVDIPEAGLQVPAGTVQDGESPERAVLREAQEETGLKDLVLVRSLGKTRIDMTPFGKSEIHDRTYLPSPGRYAAVRSLGPL